MTPSRAKEVLESMSLEIFDGDALYAEKDVYLCVTSDGVDAVIQGELDAEELQAIALWMQDPEGVTNA